MQARRKQRRVESPIQQDFLDKLVPLLSPDVRVYAVPNGGFRLGTEAIRMKAEGVRSGITDLVFVAPAGRCAWLETKTMSRGSRLRPEQEGFMNFCLRSGHLWGVYRTTEEGLAQVRAWGLLRKGC